MWCLHSSSFVSYLLPSCKCTPKCRRTSGQTIPELVFWQFSAIFFGYSVHARLVLLFSRKVFAPPPHPPSPSSSQQLVVTLLRVETVFPPPSGCVANTYMTFGKQKSECPPPPPPTAPVSQATNFYREGKYTSCSDCWKDFRTSIAAKMCSEEADALVSSSHSTGRKRRRAWMRMLRETVRSNDNAIIIFRCLHSNMQIRQINREFSGDSIPC